jgi:hypothetical protein
MDDPDGGSEPGSGSRISGEGRINDTSCRSIICYNSIEDSIAQAWPSSWVADRDGNAKDQLPAEAQDSRSAIEAVADPSCLDIVQFLDSLLDKRVIDHFDLAVNEAIAPLLHIDEVCADAFMSEFRQVLLKCYLEQ